MAMQPGAPEPDADESAPGPGGASQLVVGIQDQMSKLMDLMSQSQAVSPEDKQQFGQIMGMYQDFVEHVLGSAPGAQKPQPPGPKGQVPAEAGGAQVIPGM